MSAQAELILRRLGIEVGVVAPNDWSSALMREKAGSATGPARGLKSDLHVICPAMDGLSGELSAAARLRTRVTAELCALAHRGGTPVLGIDSGAHMIALAILPRSIEALPAVDVGFTTVTDPRGHHPDRRVAVALGARISPRLSQAPDVEVLRACDRHPIQAFSWGRGVVGAQYLPDWTPSVMVEFVDRNGPKITTKGGNRRRINTLLRREIAEEAWSIDGVRDLLADVRATVDQPQLTSPVDTRRASADDIDDIDFDFGPGAPM